MGEGICPPQLAPLSLLSNLNTCVIILIFPVSTGSRDFFVSLLVVDVHSDQIQDFLKIWPHSDQIQDILLISIHFVIFTGKGVSIIFFGKGGEFCVKDLPILGKVLQNVIMEIREEREEKEGFAKIKISS